jgi:hypothetical protein
MTDIVTDIDLKMSTFENSINVGYGKVQLYGFPWFNISIRKTKDGRLFVGWPQYKDGKNEYQKHVWFFDGDVESSRKKQNEIEKVILDHFNSKMNTASQPVQQNKSGRTPLVSVKPAQITNTNFDNDDLVSSTLDDDDDEIFQSCLKKG